MESNEEINDVGEQIDSEVSSNQDAIEFVKNVERFLSKKGNKKFATKNGMKAVRDALRETNLPLTSLVFEQEMKRQLKHHKKNELSISPPVHITIKQLIEEKTSTASQCNLAKSDINKLRKKYIDSLTEIKREIEKVYEKRRQKKLIALLKEQEEYCLD